MPSLRSATLFVALLLALSSVDVFAKKAKVVDPTECEVCMEVLEGVALKLDAKEKKSQVSIEEAIAGYCKCSAPGQCQNKELTLKQNKMCYYLDPIKKSVSQPFSLGLPKLKVCQRLMKQNPEICQVKNAVKVEVAATQADVTKLRVKQLKAILAERGVECEGCLEKDDFVKRVLETADRGL